MSNLTLAQCKADRGLVAVAHVSPLSQDFIDILNEATRRLMEKGDWWATVVKGTFQIYSGAITWPAWVGTVLAVSRHNRKIMPYNEWYDFTSFDREDYSFDRNFRSDYSLEDDGLTPVLQNIVPGLSSRITAAAVTAADVGKQVTIYGVASDSVASETLTLAATAVTTAKAFQLITRVTKEITTNPVKLYQTINGTSVLVARYEPGEFDPSYRHSTIHGFGEHDEPRSIKALIKMQFVPVSSDSDIVQVNCLAALKLMVQCIRNEDAEAHEAAEICFGKAIRELNRQLDDKKPVTQTTVSVHPFGQATRIGRQQMT